MYGIWCEVNGRMGYRQSWLKRDDEVAEFLTKQDAEEEVERLNARMNGNPYRTASFRYSVEEF